MLQRTVDIIKIRFLFHSVYFRNYLLDSFLNDATDLESTERRQKELFFSRFQHEVKILDNRSWRRDELDFLSGKLMKIYQDRQCFSVLRKYYNCFLMRDGMFIHALTSQLEEYNTLCRDIHPYLIVGAKLAEELNDGHITIENLERLTENITENAVELKTANLAENHCHLGGATSNNHCLLQLLFLGQKSSKRVHWDDKLTYESRYTIREEGYIFQQCFETLCKLIFHLDEKQILTTLSNNLHYHLISFQKYSLSNLFKLNLVTHGSRNISKEEKLIYRAYHQYQKSYVDSALLLFLTAFFYHWHSCKIKHRKSYYEILLLFIHQLNFFRDHMLMPEGKGLRDFCFGYDDPLRKIRPNQEVYATRNELLGGARAIEFRTGNCICAEGMTSVLGEIAKTLRKRVPEYSMGYPEGIWQLIPHPSQQYIRLKFGYHFIKKQESKPRSYSKYLGNRRYDQSRNFVKLQYEEVIKFYRKESNDLSLKDLIRKDKPFLGRHIDLLSQDNAGKISPFRLDLRLLLRTLDAAGNENNMPVEAYAPFARSLREKTIDFQHNWLNKRRRRLRFAFHAGEDFPSLPTGMRHVDETVQFLDYQEGDRLGHALAIGLEPSKWMADQPESFLTIRDYFDDCVWLADMALRCSQVRPEALTWYKFYEQRARELVPKLYTRGNCSASMQDFWKAWMLRRNHPDYCDKAKRDVLLAPDYFNPHNSRYYSETSKAIHDEYLMPLHAEESQMIHLRKVDFFPREERFENPDYQTYTISKGEVDFWRMVQDYQLRNYADKGLIIETNPSSNAYISDIERYQYHPIFRWSPLLPSLLNSGQKYNQYGLRKGPIRVCVNTDDMSIFSTALLNEFHILKSIAQQSGDFNYDEVDRWIKMLQEEGMRIFDEDYISPYYVVRKD